MIQLFNNYTFCLARRQDADLIWPIFEDAIAKRKDEGSDQWQDGYPDPSVIEEDIANGYGYVAKNAANQIVGYLALIYDGEPAYELLAEKWLTNRPFSVVHRLAVSQRTHVKGLATWMLSQAEDVSLRDGYLSLKVDTNFDNAGMLRVLEKNQYVYCGIVYLRGGARRAFEKMLDR